MPLVVAVHIHLLPRSIAVCRAGVLQYGFVKTQRQQRRCLGSCTYSRMRSARRVPGQDSRSTVSLRNLMLALLVVGGFAQMLFLLTVHDSDFSNNLMKAGIPPAPIDDSSPDASASSSSAKVIIDIHPPKKPSGPLRGGRESVRPIVDRPPLKIDRPPRKDVASVGKAWGSEDGADFSRPALVQKESGPVEAEAGGKQQTGGAASRERTDARVDQCTLLAPRLPVSTDQHCYEHYDFGMLEHWMSTGRDMCTPPSSTMAGDKHAGHLRCRITIDDHLPAPTGPHTMCDGKNIVLDLSRMGSSSCLFHRPGYKCDGPPIFVQYGQGSIGAACTLTQDYSLESFPRDHLRDLFSGFGPADPSILAGASAAKAPVTLLVTRERGEHANLFHATTDWLNAFMTLHAAGVIDAHDPLASRQAMSRVQVLLLDTQEGPFEEAMYHRVFSPSHPVIRIPGLKEEGITTIRLNHALFVPPGYSNIFLAAVDRDSSCHGVSVLLRSFRLFVLAGLSLETGIQPTALQAQRKLVVAFVSRRPYSAFVDHSFVGRQIQNEDAVLDAVAALPDVSVKRHDFARVTFQDQLQVMANTDILVGMHGAALTAAIYMPDWGSVVELWPKDRDMWRVFEHISGLSGLGYFRWENRDPSAWRMDTSGDYTTVNVATLIPVVQQAISASRKKLAEMHKAADDSTTRVCAGQPLAKNEEQLQPEQDGGAPVTAPAGSLPAGKSGSRNVESVVPDLQVQVANLNAPAKGKKAFIFTMDSLSSWITQSKQGGPAGERIVREGLTAALESLGYEVTTADSDEAMERHTANGLANEYDVFFFDPWTVQGRNGQVRAYLQHKSDRLFILAFFGWNPSSLIPNLPMNHVLTAFPAGQGTLFTGNTFLGFVQAQPPAETASNPPAMRLDGVVWAKKGEYLHGRAAVLISLLSDKRLARNTKLHFVLPESEKVHFNAAPASVRERLIFHGHLDREAWYALLRTSAFLIGVGNPLMGPSALDALAAGAVYIDPLYKGSVQPSDPQYVELGSQHPYLRKKVGMPHVCAPDMDSQEAVIACAQHAQEVTSSIGKDGKTHAPLEPALLPEFSQDGVTMRVAQVLGHVKR